MKKTLLITLLLIPFLGMSQTTKPIEGFLGVKFGSSKETVIAAMKAKGAIYDVGNSDAKSLVFSNVKLGSRKTAAFFVYLTNNKAYFAVFVFAPSDEPQTLEYYSSLVNDINGIYGPGEATKDFKSPFKYGDGHEILALQQGYAQMYTDWKSGENTIQVTIDHKTDDLTVVLTYQDGALASEAAAQRKAKEKSDF